MSWDPLQTRGTLQGERGSQALGKCASTAGLAQGRLGWPSLDAAQTAPAKAQCPAGNSAASAQVWGTAVPWPARPGDEHPGDCQAAHPLSPQKREACRSQAHLGPLHRPSKDGPLPAYSSPAWRLCYFCGLPPSSFQPPGGWVNLPVPEAIPDLPGERRGHSCLALDTQSQLCKVWN